MQESAGAHRCAGAAADVCNGALGEVDGVQR